MASEAHAATMRSSIRDLLRGVAGSPRSHVNARFDAPRCGFRVWRIINKHSDTHAARRHRLRSVASLLFPVPATSERRETGETEVEHVDPEGTPLPGELSGSLAVSLRSRKRAIDRARVWTIKNHQQSASSQRLMDAAVIGLVRSVPETSETSRRSFPFDMLRSMPAKCKARDSARFIVIVIDRMDGKEERQDGRKSEMMSRGKTIIARY